MPTIIHTHATIHTHTIIHSHTCTHTIIHMHTTPVTPTSAVSHNNYRPALYDILDTVGTIVWDEVMPMGGVVCVCVCVCVTKHTRKKFWIYILLLLRLPNIHHHALTPHYRHSRTETYARPVSKQ